MHECAYCNEQSIFIEEGESTSGLLTIKLGFRLVSSIDTLSYVTCMTEHRPCLIDLLVGYSPNPP